MRGISLQDRKKPFARTGDFGKRDSFGRRKTSRSDYQLDYSVHGVAISQSEASSPGKLDNPVGRAYYLKKPVQAEARKEAITYPRRGLCHMICAMMGGIS